jgi:hypothetical protein
LATVNTMMSRNIPVTFHDDGLDGAPLLPTGPPNHPNLRPLSSDGNSSSSGASDATLGPDLRQILRGG